tara:strand:- start:327 stop:542 length:216 start_codon:yes stop_codon:yes gene_type:complete
MDLIILQDGIYQIVPVTKAMIESIKLFVEVNCFELCEILRTKLTTYLDSPINAHVMNDNSGDFYGCICQKN